MYLEGFKTMAQLPIDGSLNDLWDQGMLGFGTIFPSVAFSQTLLFLPFFTAVTFSLVNH